GRDRRIVWHAIGRDPPFDRVRFRGRQQSDLQLVARLNHSVTIPGQCGPTGGAFAAPREDVKTVATIDKVSLDIAVVLGTTSMPVHQVLRLGRGAIIELDSGEDDEVKILANNFPVAKGTVIVSGNKIAVEVKEMLPRAPDAR